MRRLALTMISNGLYDHADHLRDFFFRNDNLVVIIILKSFAFSLLMLLFSMFRNHSDA